MGKVAGGETELGFVDGLAIDVHGHGALQVHKVLVQEESDVAMLRGRVGTTEFQLYAIDGVCFDAGVADIVYRDVHFVVLYPHLIACAKPGIGTLVHPEVVKTIAVAAIHFVVFPDEMSGPWIALELEKPWCGGRIVYVVPAARNQFYIVKIFAWNKPL